MKPGLRAYLRRFRRDEDGVVTVEFLIMFPLVVWTYVAMFVFFDMYRVNTQHQKAAYVISDMLARETENITPTYIDNTKKLFDYLMAVERDNAVRVSSIKYNSDRERYEVVWSRARGDKQSLTTTDVSDWDDRLPMVADMDELILVETWYTYKMSFSILELNDINLHSFVYTRPRFAPVLRYADTNS